MSGSDPRENEPARLRDTLKAVGADLGLPIAGAVEALRTAWPDVVGEEVAAHARVQAVRDGAVVVVVDAAPWATPLRYREAELVEWARGVIGPATRVERVRVRVDSGG